MPSGPVSESESRVARNFYPFSDAKDRTQEQLGTTGKNGYREGGVWFRSQDFKANTELRHSAFSRVELAVVPFEVRKGNGRRASTRDRLGKEPPGL